MVAFNFNKNNDSNSNNNPPPPAWAAGNDNNIPAPKPLDLSSSKLQEPTTNAPTSVLSNKSFPSQILPKSENIPPSPQFNTLNAPTSQSANFLNNESDLPKTIEPEITPQAPQVPTFVSQEIPLNTPKPASELNPPEEGPVRVPPPSFASNNANPPLPPKEDLVAADLNNKGGGFKKFILPLAILLIVIFLLFIVFQFVLPALNKNGSAGSNAGTNKNTPKEQITLTYWGLWEPSGVMQELFNEYEKQNPNVKIEYKLQSKEDYRERLQSKLIDGQTSEPDIFRYHNTWVPMLKEYLQPDPIKEINLNDYFPVVKKDLTLGGETFGVPLGFDTISLYYNPDMLTKAGVEVPDTWDELLDAARNLTVRGEDGKIQISGIAMGTAGNVDHFSEVLGILIYQNGGNPADTRDKNAEDSFKFYSDFYRKYKIWDETLPPSTYAFANEKVAMIFAPSWRTFQIKEINPNLKFETAPVPQLPGNKVAWATYWAEGVSRKSKNSKEAWKLLTFLSKDENLTKLYTAASNDRLFGEPYPKPSLAKNLQTNPIVGSFVNQGSYAKSWYLCSRTYDNGINDDIIKYYENSINSINVGTNSNQVMGTLYQGISQKLNKYGIHTGGDAVKAGQNP